MSKLLKSLLALMACVLLAPFAMADTAYKIRPGDQLQLEVLEDSSLNRSLLVLPDGTVSVPSGGTIRAGGHSIAEVEAAVVQVLTPNFAAAPTVYLAVSQLAQRATGGATGGTAGHTVAIYVLGEVGKPGRVDVEPGTTVLQLLSQSGGLTNFAATRRIQLRHTDAAGQEHIYLFNYDAVMAGERAALMYVQKGDVVVVPQRHLLE